MHDVVTVAVGGLIVYCYDAASLPASADAWTTLLEVDTGTHVLPALADPATGQGRDRHHFGIIPLDEGSG